jgi:hypothetical protein
MAGAQKADLSLVGYSNPDVTMVKPMSFLIPLSAMVGSQKGRRRWNPALSSPGAAINLQEITLKAGSSGKYEYLPNPNSLDYSGG